MGPNGTRPTTGRGSPAPGGAMGFEDILAGLGIDTRASAAPSGHGPTGGAAATGATRSRPAARPPVHEATAEITLDEAYRGTTRLVEVDGKRLEIKIPKGAETGTRIKLTGRGPAGGDLIVVVRMLPDARFTRRGADLERDLPLTLEEALLGDEVPIETLKGRVLLTIPPGTQPGRTFRLSGRGMPRFKGEATATCTSSPASSSRRPCPRRRGSRPSRSSSSPTNPTHAATTDRRSIQERT
jgi:curved DNA-binding protein